MRNVWQGTFPVGDDGKKEVSFELSAHKTSGESTVKMAAGHYLRGKGYDVNPLDGTVELIGECPDDE
ncbi:hypothetical protein [Streptomyces sp. 039-1]|uniref:hypothetical protein n=1 Tax=Streptomyces sp. 039-1 TaxID=2789263 RepID=UPI0039F4E50A